MYCLLCALDYLDRVQVCANSDNYLCQVDGPCPLLLGVTKARAHVWSTPTTLSPLPHSLQYRPIYSSGMSWRQPGAKPSTHMFKTTYIERPPQTIRTGGRVSQSIQKTHLANRPRTEDTRHLP